MTPDLRTNPARYAPMSGRAAHFMTTANWGLVAGALAALWFGFQIIFAAFFAMWAASPRIAADPAIVDAFFQGSSPSGVRWQLAAFGIYLAVLLVFLRLFHHQGLAVLLGQRALALRQFARTCLYLVPLYGLFVAFSLTDGAVSRQYDLAAWAPLAISVLPCVFLQIAAEEFVFRGYLQSHIAALSRHPVIWMGVPSVLFGLIHLDPTAPAYPAWAYVVWATILGVICADLTARAGTLGPALAVHFINNLSAMLFVAGDEWLFGASLYIWASNGQPWEPVLPFDALALFAVWITARLAIRR